MAQETKSWVLAPRLHIYYELGDHCLYAVATMDSPMGRQIFAAVVPEALAMGLARRLGLNLPPVEAMKAAASSELAAQRTALVHDPALADRAGLHVITTPAHQADMVARIYDLASLEAHGSQSASNDLEALPSKWHRAIEQAREAWAEVLVHDPEIGAPIVQRAKQRVAAKGGPTHAPHGAPRAASAPHGEYGIPAGKVSSPQAGRAHRMASGSYLGGQPPPAWAQSILHRQLPAHH